MRTSINPFLFLSCFCLFVMVDSTILFACQPVQKWVKTGLEGDVSMQTKPMMAVDTAANVYTVGRANDSAVVIKYDSSGALKWKRFYGFNSATVTLNGPIALDDSGYVYSVGHCSDTSNFLLKIHPVTGNLIWASKTKMLNINSDALSEIKTYSSSAVYVAGATNTYKIKFGPGFQDSTDALIMKYNAYNGNLEWTRTYDGPEHKVEQINCIETDASQNIYVGGYSTYTVTGTNMLLLKYDLSGNQQWVKTLNGSANKGDAIYEMKTGKNGFYVTGHINGISTSNHSLYTAKFDFNSILLWSDIGAVSYYGFFPVMCLDKQENVYVADTYCSGGSCGTINIKFNSAGQKKWAKNQYPNSVSPIGPIIWDLAPAQCNDVYMLGNYHLGGGKTGFFVYKIKGSTGDALWAEYQNPAAISTVALSYAFQLIPDKADNFYVRGFADSLAGGTNYRYYIYKFRDIANGYDAGFSFSSTGFCIGAAGTATLVVNGTPGVFSASPAGLNFIDPFTGEIDLANTAAGTYTITNFVAASPGCKSAASYTVITLASSGIANAGMDSTICEGSLYNLSGSIGGAASFGSWSSSGDGVFSNTISLSPGYTPGINDLTAGSVVLKLSTDDPSGACIAGLDSLVLTINPAPTVNAGTPATICANNTFTLSGSIGGGASGSTWSSAGDGAFGSTSSLATAYTPGTNDKTSGSVWLYISSNDPVGPCAATKDSLQLNIDPQAIVDAGFGITLCGGLTYTLSGSKSGSASATVWSTAGDGTFNNSSSLNSVYTFGNSDSISGNIKIYLTSNDPAGPCTAAKDSVSITRYPIPVVTINNDTTIIYGSSVQLQTSGGMATWDNSPFLSCLNCPDPVASPDSTTTFYVTITNTNGCSKRISVTIIVDLTCDDLFIPTAFSPNNDGENDVFRVMTNCVFSSYSFAIFDRWGEKVFSTQDNRICWDGNYKGKPLNSGVFMYLLEAVRITGEQITRKENILLVR